MKLESDKHVVCGGSFSECDVAYILRERTFYIG